MPGAETLREQLMVRRIAAMSSLPRERETGVDQLLKRLRISLSIFQVLGFERDEPRRTSIDQSDRKRIQPRDDGRNDGAARDQYYGPSS